MIDAATVILGETRVIFVKPSAETLAAASPLERMSLGVPDGEFVIYAKGTTHGYRLTTLNSEMTDYDNILPEQIEAA